MAAVRRSRGRLPRRVYWVRRGVLLVLVLVLVLGVVTGVSRLVGGTGSDAVDQATTAGAVVKAPERTYGPLSAVPVKPRKVRNAALAQPNGPCAAQDIAAVPVLDAPEAGSRVDIGVELSGTQPACTFEVSPQSLVVKVVDADGRDFWRSADCRGVVPKQEVVVRSAEPTIVSVRWNARASDNGCGVYSRWALPGLYDALASVQGSLPASSPFELVAPGVQYVTETPTPTATPKKKRQQAADAEQPTPSAPTASGSPAPSPKPSPKPSPSASQG